MLLVGVFSLFYPDTIGRTVQEGRFGADTPTSRSSPCSAWLAVPPPDSSHFGIICKTDYRRLVRTHLAVDPNSPARIRPG